jgi:hypothetical protein
MSNVTVNRMGPEVQADSAFHDEDLEAQRFSALDVKPTVARGLKKDEILAWGFVGGVAWVVLAVIFGAMTWATEPSAYAEPSFWYRLFSSLLTLTMASPVLLVIGALLLKGYNTYYDAQVRRARGSIVRDRWMNPTHVELLNQMNLAQYGALWQASSQVEIAVAPHRELRGIESYSQNNTAAKNDVPLLTAPTVDVGPLPPEKWFAWLDAQPHPMLAAETGGGKSTLAKAILARRIDSDEQVFVIDPHSSEWFDLPGVGGGEDWLIVRRAMSAVVAEYRSRLAERERVKQETGRELPKTHFKRLTVLFDEANNAKLHFDTTSANKKLNPWYEFIQALGSGARKVNISILMLVQSANVEDLGISGAMRENFAVIGLDSRCILYQIDQNEKRKDRRDALYAAVGGREWPATAVINGEVYLLDRSNVHDVEPRRDSQRAAWDGWDYEADAPSVCLEDAEIGNFEGFSDRQTQTDAQAIRYQDGGMTPAEKMSLIKALRRSGKTREQARELLVAYGEGLDNDDWVIAGQ